MKPELKTFKAQFAGQELTFETGQLAMQAGGAVTVRLNGSMIFASATMSDEPREGINFFPLSVDFEERMYAGGSIPGGFFRREGRPTENAILTARLTDRPLRPLFPKDMRNDVQVIMYAMSADPETPLDVIAINAASAAVLISDAPWGGPVAAVRIGLIDGEFVVNPSYSQMEESELDLRVAGTKEALLMVEAGASEVDEETMGRALSYAHEVMQPLIDAQLEMAAAVGKPKKEYPSFSVADDIKEKVYNWAKDGLEAIYNQAPKKMELDSAINALRTQMLEQLAGDDESQYGDLREAFEAANKKFVRSRILERGQRPDGRSNTEIRPIWCDVDFSPRAHGTGLFTRGLTQVLTFTTLGTPRDAQNIDNLTPTETKRYMHHYNFPPFSVGETRPLRGSSRREIGHGALAERALFPV
ncbi:MAG: polyribonucleotide nucleotidyltransferase, partial [Anaerolineales bacterium]